MSKASSNCTLLELKAMICDAYARDGSRSNCTLLELKALNKFEMLNCFLSSNCTLLELKVRQGHKACLSQKVLIVPYWN